MNFFKSFDNIKGIEKRIKHLLYIVSGSIGLAFFHMAVICNIFGGTIYDRGMYLLGIISTGALAVALIKRLNFEELKADLIRWGSRGSLRRVILFALIFLTTLYYYDSSSDYGHTVGLRIITLLFGLIVGSYLGGCGTEYKDGGEGAPIGSRGGCLSLKPLYLFGCAWMMFGLTAKYIMAAAGALNYDALTYNALYGPGSLGGPEGLFWGTMYFLPAPLDGKSLVPYLLWGLMVMSWIYVALKLVALKGAVPSDREVRGKGERAFFKALILLLSLILIFSALNLNENFNSDGITSNVKLWVISLAVSFGFLYKAPISGRRLLEDLSGGVILSFWIMAFFALLFRPYYSFEFVRYPGWFSSVASASMYRMVVAITALIGFVSGSNKGYTAKRMVYAITLGASLSVLLMGMARTSLLGTACVFFVVILLSSASPKAFIKKALAVLLCLFVAFPSVYTGLRCIPALVKRPVWITGAEWFSDRIIAGETPASSKYMNVPQLAESLLDKLIGVDINLSYYAGAHSGPPEDGISYDEDGNIIGRADNVVDSYVDDNGQEHEIRDYTFVNESDQSGANGRLEILHIYLKELNATGHRSMLPSEENNPDGAVIFHAHNTFVQIAHDQGFIVGAIFIAICLWGLWRAFSYYRKNRDSFSFAIYPLAVIICFCIAGMTEWIFHPSIPLGFVFMTVLKPLTKKV